jgi:uncharacterized phage protein (TIGR01671 family)
MKITKFRVFDPNENKMIYDDICCYVHFEDNGTVNVMGFPKQYILEQFTGLHDKNGKEIYSGDIVKVPDGWGGDNLYNSYIGDIQYDSGSYYISQITNIKKTGKWSGQDFNWGEIEILGNIHEHPELLK